MYVVLFLLASILSLAFYGYFYALCMLHIVVNNDILQRVLRSVTKNGILVFSIILFCSLTLYCYAMDRYCIAVGCWIGRSGLLYICCNIVRLPP